VAKGDLQGWHPDPFGLHEVRYFSVGNPTKLVRDGRVEAYDEPPEGPVPAAASVAATVSAPSVTGGTLRQGEPELAGATRVSASASRVPAGGTGDGQGGAYRAGANPFAQRKRRRVEYAFVALGAVVAVLVFVALGGGSRSPGIAPAAFVTKAAQRTLDQSSAEVTVSGSVQVAGQTLAMGGDGQVDFATNTMSLSLGASVNNGSMTETELLVGGNIYLQVSSDGHNVVAGLAGGRHWLEVPFVQSGSRTLSTGSPAVSLSLLSQEGARVTPLGPSSIGGRTCNGYSVTPSKQAMLAGAQEEYAKLGLSQAETNAALQALQAATPPTITAWFDSQQLACQVDVYLQIGTPTTSSGSAGVQMAMTFTHYGAPVKVTVPAPSDTISLQQLLKAATSAGSSTSSRA
jgi:hypothetical protein